MTTARIEHAPRPRAILVSGSPRTGTTLLAEILNGSPEAGIIFEYGLFDLLRDLRPMFAAGRNTATEERATAALAPNARETGDTYVPSPNRVIRYPRPARFPAIVTAVVEAITGKSGLTVIGSKSAGQSPSAVDVAAFDELFPGALHLLTVRSPLATINSMMNRRNLARRGMDTWHIDDMTAAIAEYRRGVLHLLSRVARLPDRSFVVPYEDVAGDYDGIVAELRAFTGLDLPHKAESDVARSEPFTRAILTADEEDVVRSTFPAAIAMWEHKALRGVHDDGRVDDLADCLETIVPGRRYAYAGEVPLRAFLGDGWSMWEREGVWSDDERADIFFAAPRGRRYSLLLEGSFFLPLRDSAVTMSVDADGREVFRGTAILGGETIDAASPKRFFAGPGPRTIATLPFEADRPLTHVTLRFEGATSPLESGYSGDPRTLGFLLQGITLRDV